MKKLVFLLLLASGLTSQAQLRKIPAAVTDSFKIKYPNATNVEWSDKITVFMASFNQGAVKYEARFNKDGVWVQTEHPIVVTDLPAAVNDGLQKSKYADWKDTDFYLIQLPGSVTQYRISVQKTDLQKKILLFSSTGQLLKDKITL